MNIVTRLDNNQLTQSSDSSKHEGAYELEMNPDPEPSSSDSLETLLLDSRSKKKNSMKKKKRRKHRKDDLSDPSLATTLILPMTVITGTSYAKIRNTAKRIRSDYAQL